MTTPDPAMERPMYDYMCLGGPLETQHVISRYPAGFLLVEKSTALVWIYERGPLPPIPDDADVVSGVQVYDPSWVMREGSPFIWDKARSDIAAEGNEFDVIAYGAGEQTQ